MDSAVRKSIRRELRGWADIYERMMGDHPTEQSIRKMDRGTVRLLEGRWLSHKTEAHEYWIKRPDGSKLRILIVTKKDHRQGVNEKDTGVLWIHGGGYVLGVPEMDFMFAEQLLENDNAVLIMPDYRKAAEMPYPAALDDCMLALYWMKDHCEVLGINENQLFVGGESAGGGLACAVTLRARDEGKVSIAFQMPLYPMISEKDTASSSDNHLPGWNTAYNHLAWSMYRGDLKETSKYFSPSQETDYHHLPPAFSIVSDIEPFHDETKTYFDALYRADVPVMLKEYRGCFHAFDMLAPNTKIAKQAVLLEKKAFRYAQAHFFKRQPENKKEGTVSQKEKSHTEKVMDSLNEAITAQDAVLKKRNIVLKETDKEDVFDNLQKIIEEDTASSLKSIEQLIDGLH